MTAQLDAPTQPDWRVIESLDWDFEPPCEHGNHPLGKYGHSGPAYVLIRGACPDCPHVPAQHFYLCKGAWEHAFTHGVHCRHCKREGSRSDFWTIIGYVKGE